MDSDNEIGGAMLEYTWFARGDWGIHTDWWKNEMEWRNGTESIMFSFSPNDKENDAIIKYHWTQQKSIFSKITPKSSSFFIWNYRFATINTG